METQGNIDANSDNLEATLPPDLFRQGVLEQAECLGTSCLFIPWPVITNLNDIAKVISIFIHITLFAGMDPAIDGQFLWIAERSLLAPLPPNWVQLTTDSNQIYYYNSSSGQSDWNHPSDEAYRQLYLRKKAEHSGGGLLENLPPSPPQIHSEQEGYIAYADPPTERMSLSPSNSSWPIPPPPPRSSTNEGIDGNVSATIKWENLLTIMRERMNESRSDSGVVKSMMSEAEGVLSALKEENSNIFTLIKTAEVEMYSESSYETLRGENNSLKEEIGASQRQIEALQNEKKEKRESSRVTIEEMKAETDSLNAKIKERETLGSDLKLKNESLTRQLADSRDEVSFLRTTASSSQKMIDDLKLSARTVETELQGRLKELEGSVREASLSRKSLEEQLRESKDETDRLESELNNVQATSSVAERMLKEKIEKLKVERAESQDLLSARDKKILELESINSRTAEQNKILKVQVDDNTEFEKKKDTESSEVRKKFEDEIERLEECIDGLKNDMEERDVQLKESQVDALTFQDELSLTAQTISDGKRLSQALQKELHIVKLDAQNFKEKWRNEQNRSKDLNNKLADLQGGIRVLCRVRPLSCDEKRDDESRGPNCIQFLDYDKLLFHGTEYMYDHIFNPETKQASVYDEVSSTVATSMNGVNVCIFAYGQTASGKWMIMQYLGYNEVYTVYTPQSRTLIETNQSSR